MVGKVLIANRGVCAVRIARTLRRLKIPYVAVHSEADAELPFVRDADEAVAIGGPRPTESYLRGEVLIEAMRKTGADALHPGYGFLSENAKFAQSVVDAGLTFIGPRPDQIAQFGHKTTSRDWMEKAGMPVLKASPAIEDDHDAETLAEKTGYPVLIKASAGGGGVGMQRVAKREDLAAAITRTRSIAERTFANNAIYMEKCLDDARHVEFQVFGDGKGGAVSLYERDCSVQRRHQKIIEEATIPFVGAEAQAMSDKLAGIFSGSNYQSLGTIEMLMDRDKNFYFLEVNTRLQVEHSVTEAITGLDLVEMQIRLANGETLATILPKVPPANGHAIEARIYAEDPVRFLPSPGKLQTFRPPAERPGLVVDSGYAEGGTVTPFYDPMLALVIAHGKDRSEAIAQLDAALEDFAVAGVKTNIPFLRRMLKSDAFMTGRHHTTFAEAFAKTPAN